MWIFNEHITEERPEMEDVILEFIMSKPNEFVFLEDRKDGKIKIKKIWNIKYSDLPNTDSYYNATCRIEYLNKLNDTHISIYESELSMIERKLKIKKVCQTIQLKEQ